MKSEDEVHKTEKKTIERLMAAIKELSKKKYIDGKKFKKVHTITDRTFCRLISDLKTYVPVVYDQSKRKYVIDRNKNVEGDNILDMFEALNVENDLLFFYCFVKSMRDSQYFFPPVNTSLEKNRVTDYDPILRTLEKLVPSEDKVLYDKIEYYISGHYKLSRKNHFHRLFEEILKSMKTGRLIKFRYNDATVKVEPLKLVYYNGKWFVIGYMVESTKRPASEWLAVRTYNFSHIDSVMPTMEYFPEHDEIDTEFRGSFGFYMDDDVIKKAVIRFYDAAVREAKETIWLPDQKNTTAKGTDGKEYCEFEIDYPEKGAVELISRVLSYGKNAEVISPPELRKAWFKHISDMYKRFSEKK
mgnify:CR=1 FL=1